MLSCPCSIDRWGTTPSAANYEGKCSKCPLVDPDLETRMIHVANTEAYKTSTFFVFRPLGHARRAVSPHQEPAAVARPLRRRGGEEHRGGAATWRCRGEAGVRGALRRQYRPDGVRGAAWAPNPLLLREVETGALGDTVAHGYAMFLSTFYRSSMPSGFRQTSSVVRSSDRMH